MLASRKILAGLAAAAAIAVATPAFAEGGYITMLYPDGHTATMPVDSKTADMAMTSSKALAGPIMVMIVQGKAYAVTDMKMADGKMLSDYLGTTFSMGHN